MENKSGLRRELNIVQLVCMAAGAVIGGWIAEVPYWFELSGAGTALIFPLLAILMIPVGLAFSELTAMLPLTSAVDCWSTTAFGHKVGWLTQWMMYLVQVTAPTLMIFIFLTAINYIVPIPEAYITPIAIAIAVIWFFLSNRNISFLGKASEILFYFLLLISLAVQFGFFTSGHWSMSNITDHGGFFPCGMKGFGLALAMLSVKYIGFEMTPTMIQEVKFPVKKFWIVVLGAIFLPACLYSVVVMGVGGMAPWDTIANMSTPELDLVAMFKLPAWLAIGACLAAVLHALTTIISFWASSARVTYGAAQLNQLPAAFMKLNKYGQPIWSNLLVLFFSIFFILGNNGDFVQYIYSLCNIGAGMVYLICCAAALKLRKEHPDWKRPYRAPAGPVMFVCGMLISIWIIIGTIMTMDMNGFISLVIFCAVGIALYIAMDIYRKKHPGVMELKTFTPDDCELILDE